MFQAETLLPFHFYSDGFSSKCQQFVPLPYFHWQFIIFTISFSQCLHMYMHCIPICNAYIYTVHVLHYMNFNLYVFFKLVILHFKIIGMTIEIIYTKYSYSKYCVPYMYVHLHSNNPNHNLCQVLCIIIHFDFQFSELSREISSSVIPSLLTAMLNEKDLVSKPIVE